MKKFYFNNLLYDQVKEKLPFNYFLYSGVGKLSEYLFVMCKNDNYDYTEIYRIILDSKLPFFIVSTEYGVVETGFFYSFFTEPVIVDNLLIVHLYFNEFTAEEQELIDYYKLMNRI